MVKKAVYERALGAELPDHMGYAPGLPRLPEQSNHRKPAPYAAASAAASGCGAATGCARGRSVRGETRAQSSAAA